CRVCSLLVPAAELVELSGARRRSSVDRTHGAPEAAVGGPIAAARDGDSIVIDPDKRLLELEIAPEELRQRLAAVRHPEPIYKQGALAKYARLVSSASQGAVTSV